MSNRRTAHLKRRGVFKEVKKELERDYRSRVRQQNTIAGKAVRALEAELARSRGAYLVVVAANTSLRRRLEHPGALLFLALKNALSRVFNRKGG